MTRWLLPLALVACGPKLGPPQVTYGAVEPMPMVRPSSDGHRWYVVVDTESHGERLFFLDSGYARTTCDDDFVEELGLKPAGLVIVRGVGGTLLASKAALPVLDIGGHQMDRFACIVRDLDATSSIKDPIEVDVAGVIGADLLVRFVTAIDPSSGQVRLYPPDQAKPLDDREVEVVALKRSGPGGVRFLVEAAIEGKPGWWLLDTGARGSHVDGATYGLEPTSVREDAWVGGTGKSGGSQQDLAFYDGSTVVLAGTAIRDLRLVDRPRGPFGFDLLGLNVLGQFAIVLDPLRGEARFEPTLPAPLPTWEQYREDQVSSPR